MNIIKKTKSTIMLGILLGIMFLLTNALIFANGNKENTRRFTELETTTKIGAFSSLTLSGKAIYTLQRGDTNSIDITKQNKPASLLYKYKDNSLHIKNKNKPFQKTEETEVLITYAQDISAIDMSGAIQLTSKNLTSNTLDLSIFGSGLVTIDALTACEFDFDSSGSSTLVIKNIAVDTLTADMFGSGLLNVLANQINTLELSTSGASDVGMPNTMIRNASIDTSGASTLTLWVADSLKIDSSGSGHISYFGRPALDMETSGSTVVKALSERDDIEPDELNIPMPVCQ